MDKKNARWLLNRITNCQYVNLYFGDEAENSNDFLKDILEELTSGKHTKAYCINIDISTIPGTGKDQKKAGKALADIINREMVKARFPCWIRDSRSIGCTLEQFDTRLEGTAFITFYYFRSTDNLKEKNILNSLRKFIEKSDSIYIKILIISKQKLGNWDLSPYSPLDDRLVEYIKWNVL